MNGKKSATYFRGFPTHGLSTNVISASTMTLFTLFVCSFSFLKSENIETKLPYQCPCNFQHLNCYRPQWCSYWDYCSPFPVQVVLLRIATELQQRMEYLFCRRLMSKMKLPVSLLEDEDGTREGNSRVESMGWCKQNSNCWSEVSLAAEFRGLMYILGHKVDEGEDRFYFTWQVRCRKGLVIITILLLLFIASM